MFGNGASAIPDCSLDDNSRCKMIGLSRCLVLVGALLSAAWPGATAHAGADSQLALEIKQMEEAEAEAMRKGNAEALERLYGDGFFSNADDGTIRKREEVLEAIRTGKLNYVTYTRTVQHVGDHGDTVVTMGQETATPGEDMPDAGRKIGKQYMHVWMKQDGRWKLVARHENGTS